MFPGRPRVVLLQRLHAGHRRGAQRDHFRALLGIGALLLRVAHPAIPSAFERFELLDDFAGLLGLGALSRDLSFHPLQPLLHIAEGRLNVRPLARNRPNHVATPVLEIHVIPQKQP